MIDKKLYWLEYADLGFLGAVEPFKAIGFQTQAGGWTPHAPDVLMKRVFPKIIEWKPSIIFLAVLPTEEQYSMAGLSSWLELRQRMLLDTALRHVKVMLMLNQDVLSIEQELQWKVTGDLFVPHRPFRCIKYAKAAMRLVGEEPSDIAGVNYYLSHNGEWQIYQEESRKANLISPDAEGQFARPSLTRILAAASSHGFTWVANGIQPHRLTYIVYVVKSAQEWGQGLGDTVAQRLSTLAHKAAGNVQLLVGANDQLLQAGPNCVSRVVEQAHQMAGWRVFVNEHLWFEQMPNPRFEEIVYGGNEDLAKAYLAM
jgi:hypothetical protein